MEVILNKSVAVNTHLPNNDDDDEFETNYNKNIFKFAESEGNNFLEEILNNEQLISNLKANFQKFSMMEHDESGISGGFNKKNDTKNSLINTSAVTFDGKNN